MNFYKRKLLYTFFIFISFHNVLQAQGKINVPSVECLGNLTNLSYTPPSGLTLSSATWNFGDGYSSTNTTPVHTYAAIRIYTVKINAVFTNSTSRTDSFKLEVVGIPKANFYIQNGSDSCLNRNFMKFRDTSRPAKTGQTITNRIFVFGDGTFDNSNSPKFGDVISQSYAVANTYTLKMEITDKYGCKASKTMLINIWDNVEVNADIDTNFVNCTTAEICVTNTSKGKYAKNASYRWFIDTSKLDTNAHFTKRCISYNKERSGKVMLTVLLNGYCPDTFRGAFYNKLDALPTKLTLQDTAWCWADDGLFEISANKTAYNDKFNWKLGGSFPLDDKTYPFCWPMYAIPQNISCPPFPRSDSSVIFLPKNYLMPGMNKVASYIYRGNAACVIEDSFRILGPIPNMRIYDKTQCYTNRQIFMEDLSTYTKRSQVVYKWTIIDPDGENCVNNRAKGINKYKNCNESVDWYTKHQYKNFQETNEIIFWIKDTVTGCEATIIDSTTKFRKCPPLFDKDSVELCEGDVFMNVPEASFDTVTLDGGKTWRKFGFVLDSTMIGLHDVGFAMKDRISPWAENWGDDSIKTHTDTITYFDTIYKKKFLRVYPLKKDVFTLKMYGDCKPFRASLHLKNKVFLKNETLTVNWQDGITFGMTFKNDTIIDSVFHIYNNKGMSTLIRISIKTVHDCEWRKDIDIIFGKTYGLSIIDKNKLCSRKKICMLATVVEFDKTYYWTNDATLGKRNLTWAFDDDTAKYTNDFDPCYAFKRDGRLPLRMMLIDKFGCKDTIFDTLFIQNLNANVKYLSKIVYCSELKLFLDSSTYTKVKGSPDSIKNYAWSFGNGIYSSLVKNPLQVINSSLDSIKVTHAVQMVKGCTDTMSFYLKIIGPKPYFFIRDTIGCGSLNATFLNRSRNSKSYLWEYGDSLSTLQTNSKGDVNFNYTRPGRYYIYLTGYDTIFNPLTGQTFYCKSTFPDKLFQKDTTRSVLVLPFRRTGIQSPDTICLGSALTLKSLSDTAYYFDYWQTGDSASYNTADGAGISHVYKKAGTYNIKLVPSYLDTFMNKHCRDSAQKNIKVVGVKADFDIDPLPLPPLFNFYNKSTPASALLKWDFGHPSSGSNNNSTAQNTSHDYGNDTGTYNVCLIASIPEGCSDTICKTVYNDYLTEFQIFNVFTPGNNDSKNDQYDILIEGEDLYDLEIYNRWGMLVFKGDKDGDKTNDNNWNGKVNNKGEECPSGTYYFIFKYSLRTEPEKITTVNGVITLIR